MTAYSAGMSVRDARLCESIASMVEQGQRIGARPLDIASNVLDAIRLAGFERRAPTRTEAQNDM